MNKKYIDNKIRNGETGDNTNDIIYLNLSSINTTQDSKPVDINFYLNQPLFSDINLNDYKICVIRFIIPMSGFPFFLLEDNKYKIMIKYNNNYYSKYINYTSTPSTVKHGIYYVAELVELINNVFLDLSILAGLSDNVILKYENEIFIFYIPESYKLNSVDVYFNNILFYLFECFYAEYANINNEIFYLFKYDTIENNAFNIVTVNGVNYYILKSENFTTYLSGVQHIYISSNTLQTSDEYVLFDAGQGGGNILTPINSITDFITLSQQGDPVRSYAIYNADQYRYIDFKSQNNMNSSNILNIKILASLNNAPPGVLPQPINTTIDIKFALVKKSILY